MGPSPESQPARGRSGVRVVGVFAAFSLVLAACGGQEPAQTSPASSAGEPSEGEAPADSLGLVVAVQSLDSQSWAPWLATGSENVVLQEVGETLTRIDPETREVVPALAESWELSEDLGTWTFRLREGVPFHGDWGEMTAEDVRFSWEQLIQEESTSSVAPVYRSAIDGDIANFEVVGPYEFRLHTSTPVVQLPSALSNLEPGLAIQSMAYWNSDPERAVEHPVGTGPYEFVSSTPGVDVVLAGVEEHWRQTPAFDSVTVRVIADDAARLAQLQSGEVDLAPIPPRLVGEARSAGLDVRSIPDVGSVSVFLGGQYTDTEFNDDDAPWIQADSPDQGRAIREALSMAIDRQAILDSVMAGLGTLTSGPLFQYQDNPNLVDPNWEMPTFDPDTARELMAEGGYPDGFEVTVPVFTQSGRVGTEDIHEAVAGEWERHLGLTVTRDVMDFTVFRPHLLDRTTAGMAYSFVTPYFTEAAQALGNYTPAATAAHFFDPALTDGFERLRAEPDRDERLAITRGMIDALIENTRAIPLFSYDAPYAASARVGEWQPVAGLAQLANLEYVLPADR